MLWHLQKNQTCFNFFAYDITYASVNPRSAQYTMDALVPLIMPDAHRQMFFGL